MFWSGTIFSCGWVHICCYTSYLDVYGTVKNNCNAQCSLCINAIGWSIIESVNTDTDQCIIEPLFSGAYFNTDFWTTMAVYGSEFWLNRKYLLTGLFICLLLKQNVDYHLHYPWRLTCIVQFDISQSSQRVFHRNILHLYRSNVIINLLYTANQTICHGPDLSWWQVPSQCIPLICRLRAAVSGRHHGPILDGHSQDRCVDSGGDPNFITLKNTVHTRALRVNRTGGTNTGNKFFKVTLVTCSAFLPG